MIRFGEIHMTDTSYEGLKWTMWVYPLGNMHSIYFTYA